LLEQITDSVSMIDTEALGVRGVVAAYLVVGKEKALIDMGYKSSAERLKNDLKVHGIDSEDLDYLLPTHVHLDHCGSCGTLAGFYQNASVRVHPRGQPHLSDPTRLVAGARELFGRELIEKFGPPDPISAERVRGISDDEVIDLGAGVALRAVWTPGHAPHHVSYFLEQTGTLFTGDGVGVQYPASPVLVPTSPPPSFNLQKALASIERMRSLSPVDLFTPHFGVLHRPIKELEDNLKTLEKWKRKLEDLRSQGLSSDEVTTLLTSEICEFAQRPISELPEYLRSTLRLSVLGFLGYLDWNSRR
jgi:glyoxylase-like metal-dependent hydrolase (beta-lactamase superfamily II)